MGSTAKAIMTGFICRLCSNQKKIVIHLYTQRAKKLELLKKIKLLPLDLTRYDNLPKTICEECINRLEIQYNMIQRIRKSHAIHRRHRMYHSNGRCPVECPLRGTVDPSWPEMALEESSV
ncbi:unnamed protein product [Phaedon cochleariae]|uniref:ZAD domain-containing protein n=1 Tax=Phaedon cochleariae TaxID=80249 RepID=A0A9N9SB75_PHACE|nr:unnamed protein product [Phaedon cochleariae]